MTNSTANYNVSEMNIVFCVSPDDLVERHYPILSDEARRVLEIIFLSTVFGLIGVVGAVGNIINIIIFVKQGFRDSVSISVCGLAVSDLGFLLVMILISVSSNPLFQNSETNRNIAEISYSTGGVFQSCFMRVTQMITAFITFERCVCIALPLKVKTIITPKRTLISIVTIFVFIFALSMPVFSYLYLTPSFKSNINKTLIGLKHSSSAFQKALNSMNTSLQFISYIIVIICTVILALKLRSKSEKRQKSMYVSNVSDSISSRDNKVIKMVTLISIIFIICYLPSAINFVLMIYLSPEYGLTGVYANSYIVSWAILDSLDGINSSISFLVYYNMSSKFKATFQLVFFTAIQPN